MQTHSLITPLTAPDSRKTDITPPMKLKKESNKSNQLPENGANRTGSATLSGTSAALAITGFTLTSGYPLVCLAATVRLVSPFAGESEYMCSMTLDQRRRTSPLGLTWDMGGIPAHFRRATRHLVSDLADRALAADQAEVNASIPSAKGGAESL